MAALPAAAYAQCAMPSQGLIAHWKLDETGNTSTAADSSGNGNTGILTNFPADPSANWQAGTVGGSLNFDGLNDHVDLTTAPIDSETFDEFTVASWYKSSGTAIPDDQYIFTMGTGVGPDVSFIFGITDDAGHQREARFWHDDATTSTGYYSDGVDVVTDMQWHHLAVTRGAGRVKIYVDGVLITDNVDIHAGQIMDPTPANLTYLGNLAGDTEQVIGNIDDVRVYKRALSSNEIAALYSLRSTAGAPAGKIVYDHKQERIMYCNGTDWVHAGIGSYNPNAVQFDGSNDYLYEPSFAALSDTKAVTGSFWFRRNGASGVSEDFFRMNAAANSLVFRTRLSTTGLVAVEGRDSTPQDNVTIRSSAITDSDWHHALFSFDLSYSSATGAHLYIDDVSDLASMPDFINSNVDLSTVVAGAVGASGSTGTQKFNGDMADLWVDFGTYMDFSVEANRRKFISDKGLPMYLGQDGSLPTGASPEIFMSGDTIYWQSNKGTGGGYTENGEITYSSSQPGDGLASGLVPTMVNSARAQDLSAGGITSYTFNFGFTATAGNLLVVAASWDKIITGLSETGATWTQIAYEVAGTSATGAMYYKISDGTETSISLSWTNSEDMSIWVGEFSGIDNSGAGVFEQSSSANVNSVATSISTGTTPALSTANAFAIAMMGSDSGNNTDDVSRKWSNGFAEETYLSVEAASDPGLSVAMKGLTDTSGVETTYSFTDTGDQMTAIVAAFKVDPNAAPAELCFAQARGKIAYRNEFSVLMYCNGTEWVPMGIVGGTPPTAGLVAHYTLDETSGTTAADSAGTADGTMIGGLDAGNDSVDGKLSTALNFDGTDDYIDIASPAFPTDDFTVAVWVNALGIDLNGSKIISINNTTNVSQLAIEFENNDTFEIDVNALTFNFSNYILNNWYFIVVTRSGSLVTLYVDAVETGNFTSAGTLNYETCMLLIGMDADAGCDGSKGDYWNGYIDDVRIYNRAISKLEIEQLYHYGLSRGLGDVSGNCSNPARAEGVLLYNIDYSVLQYCNGEQWIGIGQ
jgi:hypothetical protein